MLVAVLEVVDDIKERSTSQGGYALVALDIGFRPRRA